MRESKLIDKTGYIKNTIQSIQYVSEHKPLTELSTGILYIIDKSKKSVVHSGEALRIQFEAAPSIDNPGWVERVMVFKDKTVNIYDNNYKYYFDPCVGSAIPGGKRKSRKMRKRRRASKTRAKK